MPNMTMDGTTGLSFPDASFQTTAIQSTLLSLSASVATNNLTLGLALCGLSFRSATLTNGTAVQRAVPALSLVVPSGAKLGTVNAVQSRLVLLAIDATALGGAVELAVVNIAGGNNLDETTLLTTTAISGASTAINVVYSAVARANVPFRVVGYVDSTQATAGTYATAPSTVQGFGGQALAALSSLGYGQTWQNVTASRVGGTTYYNTTGRPISISVISMQVANNMTQLAVAGINIGAFQQQSVSGLGTLSAVVPPGASYVVTATNTINNWYELR